MSSATTEFREGTDLFSAIELEGLRDFLKVYETLYGHLAVSVDAVGRRAEPGSMVKALSPQVLELQGLNIRQIMRAAILEGAWDAYWNQMRLDGARYANGGLPSTTWFDLKTVVRAEVTPLIVEEYKTSIARLKVCLQSMNKLFDHSLAVIGAEYDKTMASIIVKQAKAIAELSTPVLQIREGRLIVPLIGLIDSFRAREITEHLLEAIRTHRAKIVIIDITGVPTVDSRVANHLIQTVEAARLMGAKTIVTGLSAEVAQTLVTLGVDLSKVQTVGDLQTGIEEADRIQGLSLSKTK